MKSTITILLPYELVMESIKREGTLTFFIVLFTGQVPGILYLHLSSHILYNDNGTNGLEIIRLVSYLLASYDMV